MSLGSRSTRHTRDASSFDAVAWERLFRERGRYPSPDAGAAQGEAELPRAVTRVLRVAAAIEKKGVDVLLEKSRAAEDPGEAACIVHHASEEVAHVRMLESLLGRPVPPGLPGVLGLAEAYVTRRRPVVDQMLVTLIVEAMAIALYGQLAEQLAPARVAIVLESIVDDERVHADLMREILLAAIARGSPGLIRRLRRVRSATVAVLVVAHGLLHRTYLRPVGIESARDMRSRVLREIEWALRGIPQLAVPPR